MGRKQPSDRKNTGAKGGLHRAPCVRGVPNGISIRSVDDLVKAPGMTGTSKSRVCRRCAEIDDQVHAYVNRPLEGKWHYFRPEAAYLRVRQNGRIVSVAAISAIGLVDVR